MTRKEILYEKLVLIYQCLEGIPEDLVRFSRPSLVTVKADELTATIADPLGWLAMNPRFQDMGFCLVNSDRGWHVEFQDNSDGVIPFMNWLFESVPGLNNLSNFGMLFDGRGNSKYDIILDPEDKLSDKTLFLKRLTRFSMLQGLN